MWFVYDCRWGVQLGLVHDGSESPVLRQTSGKNGRKSLLSLVRTQKDFYEKSIEDLEKASKNLHRLVQTLQRRDAAGDVRFVRMKGKLLMPIEGKGHVSFKRIVNPAEAADS